MSSWDSGWTAKEKVKVGGRKVSFVYQAIYDTPNYVGLNALLVGRDIEDPVVLDSASAESSRIDARSMGNDDVYGLLRKKLKKLDRYIRDGLTEAQLARIAAKQGVSVPTTET